MKRSNGSARWFIIAAAVFAVLALLAFLLGHPPE
jgi:hypothetical protein